MWYFAWNLGVTMAVPLASTTAMMCDAKARSLDDARTNVAADAKWS